MKISTLLFAVVFLLSVIKLPAQQAQMNQTATFTANPDHMITGYSSAAGGLGSNPQSLEDDNRSVWFSSFGGSLFEECYSAIETSDGGYALIGRTNSFGAGDFDAWLIKTDASGNELWQKTFGDSYIDEAYVIKETDDGGFIIGGMSTAFEWAGEGWLIRTDNAGNIIWSRGYHPTNGPVQAGWDYIYDIIPVADGGFIFGGVGAPAVGSMQAWVGKVDANGDLLWDKCYGLEYWERIFGMTATADGGFAAVGDRHWSYDNMMWQHDGWLLKFDANGDTTWTKHFGQVEHDIFRGIYQAPDGGFIICGESEAGEKLGFRGWMVGTDAEGNTIFNNHLLKGGLWNVQLTGDSYTAGGIFVDPYNAGEGWLVNIDEAGNVNWESLINGSATDDMFLSLKPTSDGGLIGAGKYAQSANICDYWLVKIDADGPEALTYFYENFDDVAQPYLPEKWSSLIDVMIQNTVAEIRTMENGITTSAPNAVFVMNGLDASNGQPDTTAFVAMVTPFIKVLEGGASITFNAAGTNAVQIGRLTDPEDPSTWQMITEIDLVSDFTEYYLPLYEPGEYYLAFKHSNQSNVTPIFIDDIEFKQNTVDVTDIPLLQVDLYPNPASDKITITSAGTIAAIMIHDMAGSVMLKQSVRENTTSVDLKNIQPGIYFVTILSDNGASAVRKIVVM